MSRIVSVHHINLEVEDLERAKRWWMDVLGCEPLDKGPGIGVVKNQLFLGTNEVHFTERGKDAVTMPVGHMALEVKDFDSFITHIEKLNIPYFTVAGGDVPGIGPRADGSRATFIKDSEGNILELTSHSIGLRWARDDTQTAPMTGG